MRILSLARGILAAALLLLAACGGGTPVTSHPPTATPLTVSVSAGAPLAGAQVDVYAIDDATGAVLTSRPDHGLLTSGTTDKTGTAALTIPAASSMADYFDGPIQVIAHGAALAYDDPSEPSTRISLPTDFHLTTLLAYRSGASAIVAPVTLWTTLADAAALAYAKGRNSSSPALTTLRKAIAVTDPLLARHLSKGIGWDLRQTMPVSLDQPQSLRDAVLASLPDIALNQLARDLSVGASVTPGQVITAPTILADLVADLAADGRLDGRGADGAQLRTAGTPPYAYAANTTRFDLARALDRWIAGSANKTGLSRLDLQTAGIYDAISLDASILYPGDQPAQLFDNASPSVSFAATFVVGSKVVSPFGADNRVRGTVTIVADASDPSGVASLTLDLNGNALEADPKLATVTHFVGPVDTTQLPNGPITVTAKVADEVGNPGTVELALTVDNTPPTITVAQPTAHSSVRPPIALDASAADDAGVASLVASATVTGVPEAVAITDTNPAPECLQALAWAGVPGAQDGAMSVSWTACDAVGNCSSATTPITLDTTGPLLTVGGTIPEWLTATDIDSQGQYRLTVAAVDPTGVAFVTYTLDGGGADVAMTSTSVPGQYSALIHMEGGTTTVLVTATDTLGNKGTALRIPLRRDTLPPRVLVPTTHIPSYYDEVGLAFASAAPGAAYVYADQSKRTVVPNLSTTENAITKVATRFSWAAPGAPAPTADALETTNPENTPLLYVQIPMASPDSPLSSVTYAGTLTNSSMAAICSPPSISGPLMRSALHSSTGTEIYFLPLALETLFPTADARAALASCASWGAYQIALTITATDAAGNQGILPYSLLLAIDGPPLVITEDTSYLAKTADGTNARAYSISDGTYAQLYANNSRFTADPYVRAIRYQVANPGPRPVTVALRKFSAKWYSTEQWDRLLPSFTGTFATDGFTYDAEQLFSKISNPPCGPAETWPCSLSYHLYHPLGRTSEKYGCSPNEYIAGAGTPVSIQRSVVARIYASANGTQFGETTPLATTASGSSVIPPGGYAVVYVTRPFSGAGDRDAAALGLPALSWSAPVLPGTGSTWHYDTDHTIWYKMARSYYFLKNSRTGVVNCDTSTGTYEGVKFTESYFYLRRLTAATEVLSGLLNIDTASGDATGPEIGRHSYSYQLNRTLAH